MINLTSHGILNENKAPNIEAFGIEQLSLLSAASELNDPQQFLEAMVSTVTNYTAEQLTIGDLLQLAVYHRIQAYPNSPISIAWKCKGLLYKNPDAPEMFKASEVAKMDSVQQENLEPYSCNSENEIKYDFETFPMMMLPDNINTLDPDLQIPSATLYPELVLLTANPSTAKLVNVAAWVKEGNTIQEKLEIIGSQPDLDLFDRASKASKEFQHGPYSKLRASCPTCETEVVRNVTINTNSFFR